MSMILIFVRRLSVKHTFSGLRSRWTMPLWCMVSTASIICANRLHAVASEYAPRSSIGDSRSPPATSSIAR